jgi:hypothetical protein
MNGEGQGEEGQPDTRPYFCIPYWTNPLTPGGHWDTGQQRPLPSSVVFYLCGAMLEICGSAWDGAYLPG